MTNIEIILVEQSDGAIVEHAIITHADGSFTSMLKSTYEEQQLEHLTEIPTPDEA
jgi:hypothetical protein